MTIRTIFAHVNCSDLERSVTWYGKLFDASPTRRLMSGLAKWQFTESAKVQLFADAGCCKLM